MIIDIYTDGACDPNPGFGGWGAVIIFPDKTIKTLDGGEQYTTNNRMEMMAAIKALEHFTAPIQCRIFTDSQYVQRGITEWCAKWKRNNWRKGNKGNGESVLNSDLWQRLDKASSFHYSKWFWVRGHNGNRFNEMADGIANSAARKLKEERHEHFKLHY